MSLLPVAFPVLKSPITRTDPLMVIAMGAGIHVSDKALSSIHVIHLYNSGVLDQGM